MHYMDIKGLRLNFHTKGAQAKHKSSVVRLLYSLYAT